MRPPDAYADSPRLRLICVKRASRRRCQDRPIRFRCRSDGIAEAHMRAHQLMTRKVISVAPDSTIVEAAKLMLSNHVSGLPVVDDEGTVVGIVSEGDFLRRSEL